MYSFVAPNPATAAAYLEWVLRCCGGDSLPLPTDIVSREFGCNVTEAVLARPNADGPSSAHASSPTRWIARMKSSLASADFLAV